jgi:hypothetical protein
MDEVNDLDRKGGGRWFPFDASCGLAISNIDMRMKNEHTKLAWGVADGEIGLSWIQFSVVLDREPAAASHDGPINGREFS